MSRSPQPIRIAAIALGLAVLGGGGFYAWKHKGQLTQATSSPSAESYAGYFDWNLTHNTLAASHRALVTTPLLEIGPNRRIYPMLAKRVLFPMEHTALVELREAAYWSDGALFKAQQVVDAQLRLQKNFNEGKLGKLNKDEELWVRMTLIAKDEHVLEIKGFPSEVSLQDYLASWMSSPIRQDLLEKDPEQAFQTVLGPYKPEKIPDPKSLSSQSVLNYQPNLFYYGGAPKTATTLSLRDLPAVKGN